jgi:hypothetical protein
MGFRHYLHCRCLVFHPAPCEAVKIFLSVDKTDLTRGDYFTVNIVLDNAGGIVGCSFSVHLMVF